MATVTHGAATFNTTAGNKTATATPAVGDLIVVVAPATGVATTVVADNNADGLGTYTKIGSSFTGFSTAGDLSIWVRNAFVGSATSTVFTVTQTSSTGGGLDVYRVSGMSRTGAGAVRSSGGQSTGTASTAPAPVLSLTPLSANPIITAVASGTNPPGLTAPSSFTATVTNLGYATPTTGMDTTYATSGITTATITWGSTSATAFASIAIELDTSIPGAAQQAVQPHQARIPPQPRLAGVYMGVGLQDQSYGTGQIQWNAGGPVHNPTTPSTPRPNVVQSAGYYYTGRIGANYGTPGPTQGPTIPQQGFPVRARLPRTGPAAGAVAGKTALYGLNITGTPTGAISGPAGGTGSGQGTGCFGAPVHNPPPAVTSVPVAQQLVRARIPQTLKGRIAAHFGAPVRNPGTGPVFVAKPFPCRARIPQSQNIAGGVFGSTAPGADVSFGTGRIMWSPGAPVNNPVPPVIPRQRLPVRAVLPPPHPRAGRIGNSFGGPVENPTHGPPVYPLHGPAQARFPQLHPRAGRVESSPGAPVSNPTTGPVVYALQGPVRARIPQLHPRAGRSASSPGAPVRNPTQGPVFRPPAVALRARQPLAPRGTCRAISSYTITFPTSGAVFYPADSPIRARIPQNAPRGRVSANKGAPVHNPTTGPVFTQKAFPAKARTTLPPRGHVYAPPLARVVTPQPGSPFYPATSPVRARLPQQPVLRGRSASNTGAPVRNPTTGPVFRQKPSPVQARFPLPARGRVASNKGAPFVPATSGPPVYPQGRIRPQPGNIAGLTYSTTLIPPAQPSSATISYNTGATASAITATSVNLTIPAGVLAGDLMVLGVTVFTTSSSAPAISITGGPWTLVPVTTGTNPEVPAGAGVWSYDYAYVRTATGIDPGATITLSETGSGAGSTWWGVALASYTGAGSVDVAGGANAEGTNATVTCPSETTTHAGDWAVYVGGGAPGSGTSWTIPAGTTLRQSVVNAAGIGAVISDGNSALGSGSGIGGGTFGSSATGATLWLSAFTLGVAPQVTSPPAVTQASGFFTGRTGFSHGAPVNNPVTGPPAPALHSPVRARQPLPARGRTGSGPGTLFIPTVTGPVLYPFRSPVRVHPIPPPRGRITSNAGGPVRNPQQGPAFRQATQPARSRIPQNASQGVYASFAPYPPTAPTGVITFNTGNKNSADTATSVTLGIPSGVLPGDAMLLAVTCFTQDSSAPALSITGGGGTWNLISVSTGTNPEVATAGSSIWSYDYAYYKIANGADPGSTLTISETGSPAGSTWWAVAVASYTGAAAAGTIDIAGGANAQGGAATFVACPAETTGAGGDWAVYLGGGSPGTGASFTTPAGTTTREAIVSDAGVGAVITDSNGPAGPAGTTIGGGHFSSTASGAVWLTAFTVGLSPTVQPTPRQEYSGFYATGRIAWSPGGAIENPPVSGPPVYPLHSPVQAKALPLRRALTRAIRFVPLASNPQPGPQFYPAVQPIAAKLPKPFLTGRIVGKAPGTPPKNPVNGPVFRQATSPVKARQPLPPRGRTSSNKGAPVSNPATGVPFRPASQPARIRPALPPKGRISSGFGAIPAHTVNGPVFHPADSPIQARIPQNAPRGRVNGTKGAPVSNPTTGPVFRQANQRIAAKLPFPVLTGRSHTTLPSPVRNPGSGPAVYPLHSPVRVHPNLPPRGRVTSGKGGPVLNPPAPVYPLESPVRARKPLPPRGRVTSGKGAPVFNPTAPIYPLQHPVRAQNPLPPRGHASGSPGVVFTAPAGPKIYPAKGPVQARTPLPPRGRTEGNKGAPVRNPATGPVFRQAVHPVRGIIPQNAPRGRTGSNPGGPVANIPQATLRFRYGLPHYQWSYGSPEYQWSYGDPVYRWSYGDPEN